MSTRDTQLSAVSSGFATTVREPIIFRKPNALYWLAHTAVAELLIYTVMPSILDPH